MVDVVLGGQALGQGVHIVDGGENVIHNDVLGDQLVGVGADGVFQVVALVLLQQLLENGEAHTLLDAALRRGIEVHIPAHVAHVVGEDPQGLAVHVHGDLVDADGVQLPQLIAGKHVARLVEQLAGGGVDHRVRQGPLGGPDPEGQLFVELIAAHGTQVVPAGIKEEAVNQGLGGVHRGGLAGAQLAVDLQQGLLIALAGVLLQGGPDGGVAAEGVQNVAVLLEAQGADEAGNGQLAVFVDADPEQLVGVGLILQPGAPVGDQLSAENGQIGLYVRLLAVVDAGGADDLGDHHPLRAVDDKGAGLGHQGEVPHEDLLLLDDVRLLVAQAHPDLQGRGVVHVPGLALLHIVLGRLVHAVVDEAQLQGVGVVADDAHVGEYRLQAGVQEPLVGILLDLQQVGHGHDLLMPGKVLPQRFAVVLVLGHLVILICLSAPRRREGGTPDFHSALIHTGGLVILMQMALAFFVGNCYTVLSWWSGFAPPFGHSTSVYHFPLDLSRGIFALSGGRFPGKSAVEVTPMLMIYLSAIETPEEKIKFEELYYRYRGFMLKAVKRVLRGDQDAEDAVHNAFLSIARNMKILPEMDSPKLKGFLYIVAEHKAIDILRERKRRENEEPLDEDAPLCVSAGAGERSLDWCIAQLPPRYQEIILLKYSHGYSTREIASILGVSFQAASKLDQRAKARLRELCEKEELL